MNCTLSDIKTTPSITIPEALKALALRTLWATVYSDGGKKALAIMTPEEAVAKFPASRVLVILDSPFGNSAEMEITPREGTRSVSVRLWVKAGSTREDATDQSLVSAVAELLKVSPGDMSLEYRETGERGKDSVWTLKVGD